jgi:hypothetical protein
MAWEWRWDLSGELGSETGLQRAVVNSEAENQSVAVLATNGIPCQIYSKLL